MIYRLSLLAAVMALAGAVAAQVVLTDGNSTVEIDPTSNSPTFLRGMTSWVVDGTEQLFNQSYWYRIGETAEQTIDTIGNGNVTLIGTNSAMLAYSNQSLRIEVFYTLVGGGLGSGTSDISEVVRVTNLTNSSLDFHLFEYDDFDLSGTFADDFGIISGTSTMIQSDATTIVYVGAVPTQDRWMFAEVPTIFSMLDDGVASNLDNTGSGIGPADVAFAMQWDRSIGAGGTFLMSKNKIIVTVPEPATFAALGLGILALARRRFSPN